MSQQTTTITQQTKPLRSYLIEYFKIGNNSNPEIESALRLHLDTFSVNCSKIENTFLKWLQDRLYFEEFEPLSQEDLDTVKALLRSSPFPRCCDLIGLAHKFETRINIIKIKSGEQQQQQTSPHPRPSFLLHTQWIESVRTDYNLGLLQDSLKKPPYTKKQPKRILIPNGLLFA